MEHVEGNNDIIAEPRPDHVRLAPPRRAARLLWLGVAVSIIAVVAISWRFLNRSSPPQENPLAQGAVSSAPASAPAGAPPSGATLPSIRYPAEQVRAATPAVLPGLDQSDASLAQLLGQLVVSRSMLAQIQMDGFVRRFVATVDSLPRGHAASRLWPVNPTLARLLVARNADNEVIDADNGLRYTPFVLLVEQIDVDRAASIYAGLYPLFQQAYEELGYPNQYFNDRLVEVIDHLLGAPEPAAPVAVRLVEVRGPMRMTRPWVHYEFVAPELEALSAGQKLMVRVGPVNERRLKARLRAVRAALTVAPPSR